MGQLPSEKRQMGKEVSLPVEKRQTLELTITE